MKLANIIYEKELINHVKLDYINYYNYSVGYDNKLIEYPILDKSLPTLYVGWSFMKVCNQDNEIIQNANILHKKIIANELYWECSFEESKSSHVKGVQSFIDSIPQFYFNPKYQYINLDPIFFQLRDVDDLMDVVPNKVDVSYNYKNEILYLLYENKIWGINLNTFKFFNFDITNILYRISERTQGIYLDSNGEIYQSYNKILPNFTQLRRYLVVLIKNN